MSKTFKGRPKRSECVDWLCVAVLAALMALFFWRALFLGELFLPADATHFDCPWVLYEGRGPKTLHNALINDAILQSYPWRDEAAEAWREGRAPLWNAYSFSGSPLAANGQSGAFYPPSVALWLAGVSAGRAITILAAVHFFLAGLFMFLLVRSLTRSPGGGLIAAVAYMMNGWFVGWMARPEFQNTGVWLPAILLFFHLSSKGKGRIRFALLGGCVLAVQILAGHLQVAFYSFLALGFWWALETGFDAAARRPLRKGRALKSLASAALMTAAALALSAPLWAPALKLASVCTRTDAQLAPESLFRLYGVPLRQFIALFKPEYFGNPMNENWTGWSNYTEACMYCGAATLAFAAAGAMVQRNRRANVAKGFLAIAILLVLGSFLHGILYLALPVIRTFAVSRMLCLFTFGVCLLAGFGADAFLRGQLNGLQKGIAALLPLGVLLALLTLSGRFSLDRPIGEWARLAARFEKFLTLYGLGAALVIASGRVPARILCAAAVALLVVDLAPWAMRYNTFSKPEWLYPPLKAANFLRGRDNGARIHVVTAGRLFPSNSTAPYRLEDIRGYDSLYYRDYQNLLLNFQESARKGSFITGAFLNVSSILPDLYRLTSVKHVISTWEINNPRLILEYDAEVKIYRFADALPRYRFVDRVRDVADSEQLDFLVAGKADLEKEVLIEGVSDAAQTEAGPAEAGPPAAPSVSTISFFPGDIRLATTTDSPRWLSLSEVAYPGWRGEIDGAPLELRRANYVFLAAKIPASEHQIRLRYDPPLDRYCLALALFAIAGVSGALLWMRRANLPQY